MTGSLPEEMPDFPEEPPPAYNELFPSESHQLTISVHDSQEPRETSEMLPSVQPYSDTR